MGLASMHRHRSWAATLALLGMAFYAVLIPWHTVSQATAALAGSTSTISAEPPCHSASAPGGENSKGSKPANKTHCPICSGFAALHLAVVCAAVAAAAPPDASLVLADGAQDDLADALVRAPKNRSPPHFPT
jgi:hypothetical protein